MNTTDFRVQVIPATGGNPAQLRVTGTRTGLVLEEDASGNELLNWFSIIRMVRRGAHHLRTSSHAVEASVTE